MPEQTGATSHQRVLEKSSGQSPSKWDLLDGSDRDAAVRCDLHGDGRDRLLYFSPKKQMSLSKSREITDTAISEVVIPDTVIPGVEIPDTVITGGQ